MNLPDFFYIKQTRALNAMHGWAVNFLDSFYKRSNPQNAYDSDWGGRQIGHLTETIKQNKPALEEDQLARLLRQRSSPPNFAQRPELERDIFKIETLRGNIEYELGLLALKKTHMIGWIQAGILLGLLIMLCISN